MNYTQKIVNLVSHTNALFNEANSKKTPELWQQCLSSVNELMDTTDENTKSLFDMNSALFIIGTCNLYLNNTDKALEIYKTIEGPSFRHRIGRELSDRNIFMDWMYDYPLIALRIMTGSNLSNSVWQNRPITKWEPLYRIRELLDEETLFTSKNSDIVEELNKQLTILESWKDHKVESILSSYFYQTPMFYNLSYCNINCKDILKRISNIIKPEKSKTTPLVRKGKNNRIKVGFFSQCLTKLHSVFRDRSGTITNLSSDIFEKHIIVDKIQIPHPTALHKPMYDSADYVWEYYQFCPLEKFINLMQRLNLDILIYCDIGMSPESIYFAHYRFAPIQINTWGHSVTSGISNIDYYISSKQYELPYEEAQEHYSEKLILTDSLSTYYPKIETNSNLSKKDLGLPDDTRPLISCLQMSQKLNLEFYEIMYQIWKRSDAADKPRFMLIKMKKPSRQEVRSALIIKKFGQDFFNDLIFKSYMATSIYLQHIKNSTITIDPYPFGGCNCSIEAFTYNKLVVTLPSDFLSGRFTLGFYNKMSNQAEWPIAMNKEHYIRLVLEYITNTEKRNKLEQLIENNKSKIFTEKESLIDWSNILINLHNNYQKN